MTGLDLLAGALTGVLGNYLTDTLLWTSIDHELCDLIAAESLGNVTGEFADCFQGNFEPMDNQRAQFEAVMSREFGKALVNREQSVEPDVEEIWQAYRQIFDHARLPDEQRFKHAIDALWFAFYTKVKNDDRLAGHIDRKQIDTLGQTHVYRDEGRRMMKEYCDLKIGHWENAIYDRYKLSSSYNLSREENEKESMTANDGWSQPTCWFQI